MPSPCGALCLHNMLLALASCAYLPAPHAVFSRPCLCMSTTCRLLLLFMSLQLHNVLLAPAELCVHRSLNLRDVYDGLTADVQCRLVALTAFYESHYVCFCFSQVGCFILIEVACLMGMMRSLASSPPITFRTFSPHTYTRKPWICDIVARS